MATSNDIIVIVGIISSMHFIQGNVFQISHTPYNAIPLTPPNDTTHLFMFNCENQLATLGADSFTHLPLLIQFDGIHNHIAHVDALAFAGLNNFQILNMQSNLLTAIPDLYVVKNTLVNLELSQNEISNVSFIHEFPALEVLDLSQNGISTFPNISLVAQTLKILRLSGNSIHKIDLLESFGILDATTDSCDEFPSKKFVQLEDFIFSDYELVQFPEELFYLLPKISFLLLERNNLTKMPFLDKVQYCHQAAYAEVNLVDNLFHCAKEVCFLKEGSNPDPVTFHVSYSPTNPNPITLQLAFATQMGRSAIGINNGAVVYINNIAFCTTPERLFGQEFDYITQDELHCNGE